MLKFLLLNPNICFIFLFFAKVNQTIFMIEIDNILISSEIIETFFFCDLNACKGKCCIEGQAGAPLEQNELKLLKKYFPKIKHLLPENHLEIIQKKGLYEKDNDGDWVTTCDPKTGACVFVSYDQNNIAKCAFQIAYEKGLIPWPKPISCHLYPIIISKYQTFTALNYYPRKICKTAEILGKKLNIRLYQFLKHPLIRKFGENWYNQLCDVAQAWLAQNNLNKP